MGPYLTLDGSYGEGGGQLLRTALALSVLTEQPFTMTQIRAGRSTPGLGLQHLAAVRAMAQICQAEVDGDTIGSSDLTFRPGRHLMAGEYTIDISALSGQSSAGSVGLVFQALLLPLALLGERVSRLTLIGGTHVRWSPCYHYLAEVYLPLLARIGIDCALELGSWGWYPEGNGELLATIHPVKREAMRGFELTRRGNRLETWGLSAASNLPRHIIERQRDQLDAQLRSRHIKADLQTFEAPSVGKGTVVFLLMQYENVVAGFTAYGRLRYPAEKVADDAFKAFETYRRTDGAVDPFMADQIVLPMALAQGGSFYRTSRITSHLLTVVWLVRQFLDRQIEVRGNKGEPGDVLIW